MTPPDLALERLTWPEVAQAIEDGWRTVIVPCGAVEQHGPHLPLFVDAEHGTRLGLEVARRLDKALVAPTIRIGCSEHHMAFPGTISLERETFEAVCRDYCVSLARHGFTRICLLPSHGGNFRPLAEMLPRLTDVVDRTAEVRAFTDLLGLMAVWTRIVQEESGHGDRVGGHADIAESSVMLVMHPALVKEDEAVCGYLPEMTEDVIQRILRDGFKSVTPTGVLGDARGMSHDIGIRCINAAADLVAAAFRESSD
jgi:creatinine amidohydrolase